MLTKSTSPRPDMDVPTKIPGYRIEAEIGKGGMATVYLAIQESLDRKVALKVMAPSRAADPSFGKRFLKEGKIIARLSHPNIVTVYDIGSFESLYYMAMEYVGAANLRQRILQEVTIAQPLVVTIQIAKALGYAHARGFVHRDVKPANILFKEDGTAVLSDFGIAKTISSNTNLTAIGYTVGTPDYMSPEQALGGQMDSRSDLYSLGIVFYEMLTGRKPFVAQDAFATALMHINSPIPQLPEHFAFYQPILDRLLAKEAGDRFGSAEELIESIDRVSTEVTRVSQMTATRIAPPVPTAPVESPRNEKAVSSAAMWKWGAGAGLAAVVALGATYTYMYLDTEPPTSGQGTVDPAKLDTELPKSGQGTVDPTKQEKVTRLLEAAEAHLAEDRLMEPPGSSAYDAYQLVLELDPSNEQARRGLRQIEQRLRQSEYETPRGQ